MIDVPVLLKKKLTNKNSGNNLMSYYKRDTHSLSVHMSQSSAFYFADLNKNIFRHRKIIKLRLKVFTYVIHCGYIAALFLYTYILFYDYYIYILWLNVLCSVQISKKRKKQQESRFWDM